MSRVIKYRAWVHHSKQMYFWEEMGRAGLDYWLKPPDARHELMQFTGLLDKKEREIYEGDIVVSSNPHFRGIVTWFKDLPGFMVFANKATEFSVLRGEWEVIGNIYENPELLKKEDTTNDR